jgi:hypothetical protein
MPLNRVLNELAMSLKNPTPARALGTMDGEVHQDSPDCARSNGDPILSKHPAPCEECQRLTNVYLAAIERNNEAACAMAAFRGEGWRGTWREEMKDMHVACEEALRNLDAHVKEHGCSNRTP